MARLESPEFEQRTERPLVAGSVTLHWIPLGAGARSVRFNGIAYEAVAAAFERRSRCPLYHSALQIALPTGCFMVEMTPVPNEPADRRGVVAGGPVGVRAAGRLRLFRYEVRRWRDGLVPDLAYAVASPVVTRDPVIAQLVFSLLPSVPAPTWGRDELRAGEMWSCNSITAWVLARAGVDMEAVPFPAGGRAPGWDAGLAVARRAEPDWIGRPHAPGVERRVGRNRIQWTVRNEQFRLRRRAC